MAKIWATTEQIIIDALRRTESRCGTQSGLACLRAVCATALFAFLIPSHSVAGEAAAANLSWKPAFSYSIVFHCGASSESFQEGSVSGFQATLIQVHNPSFETTVRFKKRVARALPFQEAGAVSDAEEGAMKPGEAIAIECDEIRMRLPASMTTQFRSGILFLQTSAPLIVSATYSARPRDGEIATLDIEMIEGIELGEASEPKRADLIVKEIDMAGLRFDCTSSRRTTCVTSVDVTLANIGEANAGPFQTRGVLDPAQSVMVTQAVPDGIAAGASRKLTLTTPSGPSCFDPICEICVTVDVGTAIAEADETNNQLCGTRRR